MEELPAPHSTPAHHHSQQLNKAQGKKLSKTHAVEWTWGRWFCLQSHGPGQRTPWPLDHLDLFLRQARWTHTRKMKHEKNKMNMIFTPAMHWQCQDKMSGQDVRTRCQDKMSRQDVRTNVNVNYLT